MSDSDYGGEDQGTWIGSGDSGGYWEPAPVAVFNDPAPTGVPSAPVLAPAADIGALYQEYLGRAPDPTGIAANQGASPEQIRASILASPEYASRMQSQAGYGDFNEFAGLAPGATPESVFGPISSPLTSVYQELLGRAPDPSGIASFSGMAPEQVRAAILASPEYQGLHPEAGWEWQERGGGSGDSGGEYDPFWYNVNTGQRREAAPVTGYGSYTPVDVNTLPYHLAPNYEGTPTQFYDEKGNLKGILADLVGRGGEDQVIIDPSKLNLALKPGEKVSVDTALQQTDSENRLLWLDPYTGEPTTFNTGIPATSGTVGDYVYFRDPGSRGGIIDAPLREALIAAVPIVLSGGAGAALMGQLGSVLGEAGLGALSTGSPLLDAAVQSALTKGATKAISGGDIANILQAAGMGAVSSLGGAAFSDIVSDIGDIVPVETPSPISAPTSISDVVAPTADDYLNALVEGYQSSNVQPILGSEMASATMSDAGPISFSKSLPSPVEADVGADVSDAAQNLIDKLSTYTDIPIQSVVPTEAVQDMIDRGLSAESIISTINRLLETGSTGGALPVSVTPPSGGAPISPPGGSPISPPGESPISPPAAEAPVEAPFFPELEKLLETTDEGEEEDDESKRRKKKRQALAYYLMGKGATDYGALPGNLQGTFLQGVNVNEYNPFEGYNLYQQLQPVRAAQGGSPLQLAQMQQSVYGVDPALYSVLQKRQTPNYFTYGADTSGGNPTTFSGSQLMGKPSPVIPLTPTGKPPGGDWLYQGSGTNPLAMAGTGLPNLPTGMMAEGGQAHGEGDHVPEFITGATGHYVKGRGDGQSDDIPAMLADGEYVFDADTVAQLGNGSSDAGAAVLDKMRQAIRAHKRSAPVDEIPPKSKSPLEYLAEATKGKGK